MVRVITHGFSTPRSRHSSGEEMIDRFAAMKAVSALNENEKHVLNKDNLNAKTLDSDCNTDTNDSFSGFDSEEDVRMHANDEKQMHEMGTHQDSTILKKERRRQRNKLSAQNYRQRRRQQTTKAQKTLESLETQHKYLMEKVRQMEAEKHIVEEYLRSCVKIPWCPYHQPCSSSTTPTIPENDPSPGTTPDTTPPSIPAGQGATAGQVGPVDVNCNLPSTMCIVNNNMPLSISHLSMATDTASGARVS